MKCKELQIGDWVQDKNGFQWQIIGVGDNYAYATFEGNEGDPWEFNDKDDQPEGIPLTKEILDNNGFRYDQDYESFYRSNKSECCIYVEWYETSGGRNIGYIECSKWDEGRNSVTIRKGLYVHVLQHALRVVGLSEIADNFKV